ncbi:MAG: peptidase inhibitor family I36 protein [Burkholderiales bacterium]|nr:peptidase inhibitor family I36 protein [Burkholderiales bacterium]
MKTRSMRSLTLMVFGASVMMLASSVQAQNQSKVCFYEGINYSGASYCAAPGIDTPDADQIRINNRIVSWNKRIQSIQLQGDAKVTVWEGKNYTGPSINIIYSTPNLAQVKTTSHGVRDWSNAISSYKPHY